jgi:RNA polymerase sigma factor (sigma-70 family)
MVGEVDGDVAIAASVPVVHGAVTRYVSGNDGFDDWYIEARPKVLAAVALWCGSVDVAADAADEAFVRALDRWPKVRAMASPTGWTVTVVMNVARRRARRRSMETAFLRRSRPSANLPEPAGEVFELVKDLARQQRTIVLLRYVADLPQAEIATQLGVSRSTVSTALTDAHRRLRSLLGDEQADPTSIEEHRDD